MSTASKLLAMKEKIEEAKSSLSEQKGRREELLRRLEKEYGVGNEKEARKLLKKLNIEAETAQEELESKVSEIEEALEDMEG